MHKHRGGESSVNNHNWTARQQAASQAAPVANEASWLSTPTAVERLQAAAAITENHIPFNFLAPQPKEACL